MMAYSGDRDNTVAGAAAGIGARVLVTGGAGYIGSHTCKALHAAGYVPVVLDSLVAGHREFVRWGPLVGADIRDTGEVVAAIKRYGVTSVVHFASLIAVGESVRDPALYYDVNVAGTLSLLRAMRQTGVQRIVFSSSAAVYGMPQAATLNEAHALNPVNPYGWSKYMAERMLQDHAGAYGLRYLALRYFNVYGPRQDPASQYAAVVPRFINAALSDKPPTVFGDGLQSRDFVYVDNVIDANLLACQAPAERVAGQVINIGCGQGCSLLELISTLSELTGRPITPEHHPGRSGEVRHSRSDIRRATELLGYRPRYLLRDGLQKTLAWYRDGKGRSA